MEGRGRYGNNSRTGGSVREEMKEGQSGSGEHGAREGGKGKAAGGIERGRRKEGNEGGKEAGKEAGKEVKEDECWEIRAGQKR